MNIMDVGDGLGLLVNLSEITYVRTLTEGSCGNLIEIHFTDKSTVRAETTKLLFMEKVKSHMMTANHLGNSIQEPTEELRVSKVAACATGKTTLPTYTDITDPYPF